MHCMGQMLPLLLDWPRQQQHKRTSVNTVQVQALPLQRRQTIRASPAAAAQLADQARQFLSLGLPAALHLIHSRVCICLGGWGQCVSSSSGWDALAGAAAALLRQTHAHAHRHSACP